MSKKCIDQPRCAPADIDDRSGCFHASCPNEVEGNVGLFLKPTDSIFILSRVYILPMVLPAKIAVRRVINVIRVKFYENLLRRH